MLFKALSCILFIAFTFRLAAEDKGVERAEVFGGHHGYLFEVSEEKDRRDLEMVLLEKPKAGAPELQEIIFDEKLSREFQSQYAYRFGTTAAEQTMNSVSRNDNFEFSGQNLTVLEYRERQRQFGEYMGRRLSEHHVDNWAKNDPSIRPIYEVKDKISNVNVKTEAGYKYSWQYSFAGNYMDFKVENPYKIDTKVTLQMSQAQFGPSEPEETIYSLGYQLTKKVRVSTMYKEFDGVYQIIGTRQLTPRMSTSLTGSFDKRVQGPNVQQDLVLVGVSWRD